MLSSPNILCSNKEDHAAAIAFLEGLGYVNADIRLCDKFKPNHSLICVSWFGEAKRYAIYTITGIQSFSLNNQDVYIDNMYEWKLKILKWRKINGNS